MLGHPHRRLDEGDMRAPEAGQGPGSEAKRLRRITWACSRRPSTAADTAFSRRSVHRWVSGEPATSRCPCVSGCPSPKRRRDPLRWEPFFARDRRPCGTEFIGGNHVWTDLGLRWITVGRENSTGRGVRIRGLAGRLRCSTDVSMVETTDFAKRHNPAGLRPFDAPPVGRVLVEREMRACAVIVREVRG